MKSSSFGARTSGSRISSSSPKSIPGIGRWAFWRCCLAVWCICFRRGFPRGYGQDQEWIVMTGGCDLWVTGLGVLVCLGDFETMQGRKVLGHKVQPHSPRGQPGLPGRVKAGVGGTIVTVRFYSNQGSCR